MMNLKHDNLYVAYGSNLNHRGMKLRCPDAVFLGTTMVREHRLVFRGVADIVKAKDMRCPVGVWEITPKCEASLDRYEGVGAGLYRKELVQFDDGKRALVYAMNDCGIHVPSALYFETIEQGYRHCGLDTDPLYEALRHAKRYQRPTKTIMTNMERRANRDPRHSRLVV